MSPEVLKALKEAWKVLDDIGLTLAGLSDESGYPRWLEDECEKTADIRDKIEKLLDEYGKPCECLNEIGKELPSHLVLNAPLIGPRRILVDTVKLPGAPRGSKTATIIPLYCPFCGTKYPEEKDTFGHVHPGATVEEAKI